MLSHNCDFTRFFKGQSLDREGSCSICYDHFVNTSTAPLQIEPSKKEPIGLVVLKSNDGFYPELIIRKNSLDKFNLIDSVPEVNSNLASVDFLGVMHPRLCDAISSCTGFDEKYMAEMILQFICCNDLLLKAKCNVINRSDHTHKYVIHYHYKTKTFTIYHLMIYDMYPSRIDRKLSIIGWGIKEQKITLKSIIQKDNVFILSFNEKYEGGNVFCLLTTLN